jgi:dihydrolipoamide dehydrogenase
MNPQSFDVVVIGAGPGGYVAAIRGAQLGKKVAVIEAHHLGGVCLNWGCIPTKALLRSSELYHLLRRAQEFGLKAEKISYDFSKIIKRSHTVAGQLSKGVHHLLKKNQVTVLEGWGTLTGRHGTNWLIRVENNNTSSQTLSAQHVILATGARARTLPELIPDGKDIWSYREAIAPEKCPASLLIVGSGAIGIEFASFYHHLGASVTVIEVKDRILPAEDEEISALAQKAFEKQGITILTNTQVTKVQKTDKGLHVTLNPSQGAQRRQDLTVDNIISAVGIVGNVENLGLEHTKVRVEKGHIVVNEWCETGEDNLYAIGDVASGPWLAHKASHEGTMVMERLAGQKNLHPIKRENIPSCTYSSPQIASVGLTEQAAREAGHTLKIGRFPFVGNGKAIAIGEAEGLIKTIFDANTGELLGAHMIGAEVTELIQGYVIAKTAELTEAELMHTIFAHPTLSEMMHEAVLSAYGLALHI